MFWQPVKSYGKGWKRMKNSKKKNTSENNKTVINCDFFLIQHTGDNESLDRMRIVGPTQFLRVCVIFFLFFRFLFLFLRGYMPFLKKNWEKSRNHSKIMSVLLSALVEIFIVSRMQDFFLLFLFTVYHCFTVFTGIFFTVFHPFLPFFHSFSLVFTILHLFPK